MVEILVETPHCPSAEALAEPLQGALEALMARLELSDRELTVVLTDDVIIAARNLAHRGAGGPTDVLSYPTLEPGEEMPEVPLLGDIFISVETAKRQAKVHGHALLSEVKVLAAHGLTHLMGYDHPTEEAWRIFREHQRLILGH